MSAQNPAVLVGAIMGDIDSERAWGALIGQFTAEVAELTADVDSPVRLDVQLQVAGRMFAPDFEGVRTGRFLAKRGVLIVQAALPLAMLEQGRAGLVTVLAEVLDEAERHVQRRHIAANLSPLRTALAPLEV